MEPCAERWAEQSVQFSRAVVNIWLARQNVDDAWLREWCVWASKNLPSKMSRFSGIVQIDLSKNSIGDSGCLAFIHTIKQLGLHLQVLKMHHNRLGNTAAHEFAKYMSESKFPILELHLSHNMMGTTGIMELLEAVAGATEAGKPRYPMAITYGRRVPLWLRIEHNLLNPRGAWIDFLAATEKKLVQIRLENGFLPPGQRPPRMMCEAVEGHGCNTMCCASLHAKGMNVEKYGPILHVPHFQKQDQQCIGMNAANGTDLPRSREMTPEITPPPSPCRYTDVRLRLQTPQRRPIELMNGATSKPGLKESAPVVSREDPSKPVPAVLSENPSKGPSVGERVRVKRPVMGPSPGWDATNFLAPLTVGDEVKVLYVGSSVTCDSGWLWAESVDSAGWLSAASLTSTGCQDD